MYSININYVQYFIFIPIENIKQSKRQREMKPWEKYYVQCTIYHVQFTIYANRER